MRRKEEIKLTEGQKPEKSAPQKQFYIHLHNNAYLPLLGYKLHKDRAVLYSLLTVK